MTKKSYDDWRLESMDKIDKLISVIREEGAIVNNVGDGKIAGTTQAGDDPPVRKRDELMFAKPLKRKLGPWIKSAIRQGKKDKVV
tara:strand:- start:811 stop:1065 length:255 start_codon:yes stop_codon:yes gene_type:complete